jgi:hypothetical protein
MALLWDKAELAELLQVRRAEARATLRTASADAWAGHSRERSTPHTQHTSPASAAQDLEPLGVAAPPRLLLPTHELIGAADLGEREAERVRGAGPPTSCPLKRPPVPVDVV